MQRWETNDITSDSGWAGERLSAVLGRTVRLTNSPPPAAILERVTPEVEADAGEMTHVEVGAGAPEGTFFDFAPIHVITTATLAALARAHPQGHVDYRRFRPNVVVRMSDGEGAEENDWTGGTLTIGDHAQLQVITPTPRCAIPSLAHGPDLPRDGDVLRAVSSINRTAALDLGVLACAGAYAVVAQPGLLRVGDAVTFG